LPGFGLGLMRPVSNQHLRFRRVRFLASSNSRVFSPLAPFTVFLPNPRQILFRECISIPDPSALSCSHAPPSRLLSHLTNRLPLPVTFYVTAIRPIAKRLARFYTGFFRCLRYCSKKSIRWLQRRSALFYGLSCAAIRRRSAQGHRRAEASVRQAD